MVEKFLENLDGMVLIGLFAQLMFAGRFVVQWIASERYGRSVVPIAFWYLSIFGSSGLLFYAIIRADPVFILGQTMGNIIYVRNLMLVYRERGQKAQEKTLPPP
ncbi:MAG TPA: lipid-A-disaccharide synthase N-terminal domain-containing protein [Sedimentisphaerales bacterium]|nr:lipid-A-disaccharide synthase N-terminal domain-containing protein [Sedimentisphaerales bacterium]